MQMEFVSSTQLRIRGTFDPFRQLTTIPWPKYKKIVTELMSKPASVYNLVLCNPHFHNTVFHDSSPLIDPHPSHAIFSVFKKILQA